MITFFRKIRQHLLSENKFSKYLIYAIGEIILVVIGILIALQINNANEVRKTSQKQRTYLSLVKNEMANNVKSLRNTRNVLAKSIESQRKIIGLMDNKNALDTISERDLSQIMLPAISSNIAINHENGVLSELISSGSLKDIENDSIKAILSSWDGKVYKLREQEKSLREWWVKNNDLFEAIGYFRTIFDHTNYADYVDIARSEASKSNKHILASKEFENIILIQLASSRHLDSRVYPDFENAMLNLIELIDIELKKSKKDI